MPRSSRLVGTTLTEPCAGRLGHLAKCVRENSRRTRACREHAPHPDAPLPRSGACDGHNDDGIEAAQGGRIRFASFAVALTLTAVAACDPFAPVEPEVPSEDLACGASPGPFDPNGDVLYAVSDEGCARLERRPLDDGTFAPVKLVVHVDGLTRRIDVDTDALTYEGAPDRTAVVTSNDDDVNVQVTFDVCTGEWMMNVNEGEAVLSLGF